MAFRLALLAFLLCWSACSAGGHTGDDDPEIDIRMLSASCQEDDEDLCGDLCTGDDADLCDYSVVNASALQECLDQDGDLCVWDPVDNCSTEDVDLCDYLKGTVPGPTPTPTTTPATTTTPTPAPTPAPTPVPPGVSVQTTSFSSTVELDDVTKFDSAKYVQSVVATSPASINPADVQVKQVEFQIEQKYTFADTVSVDQAKAAVADLHGVNASAVTVTKDESRLRRRLNTLRRLNTAKFTAVVKTTSASHAAAIAAKADDKDLVAASLKSALGSDTDPAVEVDGTPKTSAVVDVEVMTTGGKPIAEIAPEAALLSQELTKKLGTAATASVENPTQTSTNEQPTGEASAAVSLRHGFVLFSCLIAMLAAHM